MKKTLIKKPNQPKSAPKGRVYFDYASGAPLRASVKKYMRAKLLETEANPGSIHASGVEAARQAEAGRASIAYEFRVHSDEIIFTGSATESCALAILGTVRQFAPGKVEIVTTSIEHPAVLENCRMLEREGYKVTYVAPEENGIVSASAIKKAITSKTVLVSVMYAQNEIGTIMSVRDIAKVVRAHRAQRDSRKSLPLFFHTDATQAVNYLDIQFDLLGVDMLSFNSAKLGGPKGVGALIKKRNIKLLPLYAGGGQESGLRPGTTAPMLVGAFAQALSEVRALCNGEDAPRRGGASLTLLRDYLFRDLKKQFPKCRLNGDLQNRLPSNVHVSFPNFDSEVLVLELDARGIAVSSVSACKNEETFSSHVLAAMYPLDKKKWGTVRISLGTDSTPEDCEYLLKSLKEIFKKYENHKI